MLLDFSSVENLQIQRAAECFILKGAFDVFNFSANLRRGNTSTLNHLQHSLKNYDVQSPLLLKWGACISTPIARLFSVKTLKSISRLVKYNNTALDRHTSYCSDFPNCGLKMILGMQHARLSAHSRVRAHVDKAHRVLKAFSIFSVPRCVYFKSD